MAKASNSKLVKVLSFGSSELFFSEGASTEVIPQNSE